MENDSQTTTLKSSTRWDASTYEASYVDAVRLIIQTLEPLLKTINLPKNAEILEIGIGSGKFSASLSIMGYVVTAMDNNTEMLDQARMNFPNIIISYKRGDIRGEPKQSLKEKFDLVLNEGVLEHFLNRDLRVSCIGNMKKYCIAGGYVFFYVPFLSDKPDEHRYTSIKEMESELRDAGFTQFAVDIGVFSTSTNVYNMLKVLARNV